MFLMVRLTADCVYILYPENTHLLRKGKYHCTADPLFPVTPEPLTKKFHDFQSGF